MESSNKNEILKSSQDGRGEGKTIAFRSKNKLINKKNDHRLLVRNCSLQSNNTKGQKSIPRENVF